MLNIEYIITLYISYITLPYKCMLKWSIGLLLNLIDTFTYNSYLSLYI